jgi:ankyrin repeat protein
MTFLGVIRGSWKRMPFLKLAKQGRYDDMKILLLQERDDRADNSFRLNANGKTILHKILQYQPPVEIVHLLILRLAEKSSIAVPEELKDTEGRTTLHVAVAHGCHAAVIHRLLHGVSRVIPAVTKDNDDRLPLHLACLNKACGENLVKQQSKQPTPEDVNNMVQVVNLLLSAYPVAAAIRDSNGDTPLDLARRNGADSRILRALTICAERNAPVLYTIATASAATKSGNGTVSSQDVPTEITNSLSRDTDDLSSISIGGVSTHPRGPKSLRIGHLPGSIVVESNHGNSSEVLEKCWFV